MTCICMTFLEAGKKKARKGDRPSKKGIKQLERRDRQEGDNNRRKDGSQDTAGVSWDTVRKGSR